jgi:hypothetical protein
MVATQGSSDCLTWPRLEIRKSRFESNSASSLGADRAWRGFPFDWYPPAPILVFPFPPMLAALKHSLQIGDQWGRAEAGRLPGPAGIGQMATYTCSVETFAISRPPFLN